MPQAAISNAEYLLLMIMNAKTDGLLYQKELQMGSRRSFYIVSFLGYRFVKRRHSDPVTSKRPPL